MSLNRAHGRLLAACGYEFTFHPLTADMPERVPMPTRAPVTAELCEIPVQVTVAEAPPLSDLDLGQFGAYRFDASCGAIWIRRPAIDVAWELEALCGPVLLHALAQRGVFVLHASAARRPGEPLIAFTADSGVGKSTLARVAADLGWQRVADDLLPIAERDGQMVALPHLLQPKLADTDQYPADAPAALPLAALVQLKRGTVTDFKRLAAREAGSLVLSSTVATRVCASQSLESHLAFAARLSAQLTAGRLIVGRMTIADRPENPARAAGEVLDALGAALGDWSCPRFPETRLLDSGMDVS